MVLFSLPRELRDKIFSLVFHPDLLQDLSLRIRGDATQEMHLPLCMLTCKQFYIEALPMYIRSLQLVVPVLLDLNLAKLGFITSASELVLSNLQSVSFTDFEHFRTECPSEESVEWDIQKDMPWRPYHEYGPVVYFTGTTSMERKDNTDCNGTFSPALVFLHTLPRLHHVELSTRRLGNGSDKNLRGVRRYYDPLSLATLPMLELVKIIVRLGGIRGKIYRSYLKKGEDRLGKMHRKAKARLDDGMGLISWLEEGFRKAGKKLDIVQSSIFLDHKVQRTNISPAQ